MNLLWKQYKFVSDNVEKPHSTFTTLRALPLTPEQKHVLFGFILKWFGGYPVENMNKQYNTTLRLIEKEFLAYEGTTPEKEFCQKDWEQYKRVKQIKKMINEKIINVTTGLEQHEPAPQKTKPQFKLSEKKGAKIDLIRVLNAFYELRLIDKVNGQTPTKQKFIEELGGFLGVDLSKYHTNLSQSLRNQPLEVNLKVFEEMKEAAQKAHYSNE